jgi:hypothetical protein
MVSRGKTEQQAARNARLSAALRENLKRRKAQARGRKEPAPAGEVGSVEAPDESPASESKAPDFRRNRGRD